MRSNRVLLSVLLAILAPALQAAPVIENWQTANGARVLFLSASQLPMVDVQVMFDAGSARDGEQYGVALMTAGMLEEGAGRIDSDEIARRFDELGASFSASASRDSASASLRVLSDPAILNPALDTMAMILAQPDFPAEAYERERDRLRVGFQRKAQSPGSVAGDAFYAALYGDHPYAHPPEGDAETLDQLTIAQLQAFHQRYYVGSNAVVAIVGKLTRAEAERVAETVVGQLPRGSKPAALPPVPPLTEGREIRIDFPSSQTHILVGQPVLTRGDADYFELYVGNHILGGGGFVSRLTEEIREKRGLAYSVYSYFAPMRQAGPFQMGLQTKNDQAEQALGLLRENLQRYLEGGPTADEVAGSISNITGGFPLRIDSNRKLVGYLAMIGFYGLPLDYLDRFNGNVNAVTGATLHDAFKRRVAPDKLITIIVGGQAG